ncbi:MAG: extracellular solute-binding protein [bacterium]
MTKFQTVVIGVFLVCIVVGLILLSTYKGGSSATDLPAITIWGTIPSQTFTNFLAETKKVYANNYQITYVQKSEKTFNSELISALANGESPDAVLAPYEIISSQEGKYATIPYATFPERNFRDMFLQEGEMFLGPSGVVAIPFSVDPLVMYWNKDIFSNVGRASYPTTWTEFQTLANKITVRDDASNISRSAVAFGEWRNVTNAKEIFSALLFQDGDPVSVRSGTTFASVLGTVMTSRNVSSAEEALNFYTSFSNPTKQVYSWNRSLPQSKTYFIAGNLGTYFGFASEFSDIRDKNPNLNFDIAPIPQIEKGNTRATYGKMIAFAYPKMAKNANAAYQMTLSFLDPTVAPIWSKITYLPPVRKDLLSAGTTDPYQAIFYDSAIISHGWLDPNSLYSAQILQDLIESYTSGKDVAQVLINRARDQLNNLGGTGTN